MTVPSVGAINESSPVGSVLASGGVNTSLNGLASQDAVSFSMTLAKVSSEMMALRALSGSTSQATGSSLASSLVQGEGLASSSANNTASLMSLFFASMPSLSAVQPPITQVLPGSSATTASYSGTEVAGIASKYVGTPYLWGGTTPSGFDCSGFTQYVYSKIGIELPRTTGQQAKVGTPISSIANAKPGDLLFFVGSDGTVQSPGHVGIYVGNGQMIDAPYTGTTVQVQSLSTAGKVVEIRRILGSGLAAGVQTLGTVAIPSQYMPTVLDAANANGIPASLLGALLSQESGFNPAAVSHAGAVGIAQFMPSTALGMGVNPYDPTSAIYGAAKLISSYLAKFGSYAEALAAYNAGAGAVESYGGIPPYPETQAYVKNILSMANLPGGTVL